MIPYLNKPKLTVVTNGVMHASLLADQNVRTILVGGELKNTTKAIIGVKAVSSLTQLRFNKAFWVSMGSILVMGSPRLIPMRQLSRQQR